MLCKHHFSKNGQVFFHIFWVVTLIMQSRGTLALNAEYVAALATFKTYFNVFYESDQAILAASVYKDMIQKRLEN